MISTLYIHVKLCMVVMVLSISTCFSCVMGRRSFDICDYQAADLAERKG